MGVAAFAVWAYIAVRAWAPAAKKRGGHWYLEAILLIAGPLCLTTETLYAAGFEFMEPINRLARYIALALSVIAIALGARNPRKNAKGLLIAVTLFYLALIISGLAAVELSLPEVYIFTPLVVLAFLIPGDYTYEWLRKAARFSLRTIILLSGLSILVAPDIAFLPEVAPGFLNLPQFQGTTGHPNTLAVIAVLGLLLELHSKSKWLWRLFFLACVVLAQSSTGYVTAIVGVLLLNTSGSKALRALLTTAAIGLMVTAILAPDAISKFFAAILPQDAETFTGRTDIWAAAMYGFQSSPITGYGPDLLGEDFRALYLPGFSAAAQAHNQFVQSLAGAGIIGAATLALLILVLVVYSARRRMVSGGLSFALLSLIVLRGVTETPLRPTGINFGTMVLIITLGLIAVAASEAATKKQESPHPPTQ